MSEEDLNRAIGGRIGLRNAARQLLGIIDQLSDAERQLAGYTLQEITLLERISVWKMPEVDDG